MRLLLIVLVLLMIVPPTAQADDERLARLQRGLNLPFWFWPAEQYRADRFVDADFALIRDLGFTYVRLPIHLPFLLHDDGTLRTDHLAELDAAIERIVAHELAVMVDLHETGADFGGSNYSAGMDDPAFVERFIEFWRALATHLSATDPAWVFLEPLNEPVFSPTLGGRSSDWPPIQERLIGAIREAAPHHTIVATGALWSSIDALVNLEPLDDPNLVYSFHFYDPFVFTHQGANWSTPNLEALRGTPVAYPPDPDQLLPLIEATEDTRVAFLLRFYLNEGWDADRMATRFRQAARWGHQHGVPVICNEFGVFKRYAPAEGRAAWTHDVVTALERYNIGWAMWEYDEGFGLVERFEEDGSVRIEVDAALAAAMGLDY